MPEAYGSRTDRHTAGGNFRGAPAHLQGMRCDRFREAISARIDGEDPGLPDGAIDAHLGVCAGCRDWQQRAHAVTRRARLGGLFPGHDLTPQVLAAAPAAASGRGRRFTQRAGLAAMAVAQLAITIPVLLLGHDHDAGLTRRTSSARSTWRWRSRSPSAPSARHSRPGLAWPCAIAAAGLTGTAVIDMIGGQTPGADEAQHLVAVAGALLLIWQARTNSASAGAVADASAPGRHPPRHADAAMPRPDAAARRTARQACRAAARRRRCPFPASLPAPARAALPGPETAERRRAGGTEAVA